MREGGKWFPTFLAQMRVLKFFWKMTYVKLGVNKIFSNILLHFILKIELCPKGVCVMFCCQFIDCTVENNTTTLKLHFKKFLTWNFQIIRAFLGLMKAEIKCKKCSQIMKIKGKKNFTEGCIWACRICDTSRSIRYGSCFFRSRLNLGEIMILTYKIYGMKTADIEREKSLVDIQ